MAARTESNVTATSPPYSKAKSHELSDVFDPRKPNETLQNLRPHPETGRLIDSHPGKRTKTMRVLCLGM